VTTTKPHAWLLEPKIQRNPGRHLVRGYRSTEPTAQDIELAELDGDYFIPLYEQAALGMRNMSEVVYVKRGRRYVPVSDWERHEGDRMKCGTFRLTYCYADGLRRYAYDVTPDTASFMAACELARQAMEDAINKAAIAKPSQDVTPYTKRQMAIIERFRAEMAEAGGLVPSWWQHSSSRDISQAAIDAVRNHRA
jgi:hypothetical protein